MLTIRLLPLLIFVVVGVTRIAISQEEQIVELNVIKTTNDNDFTNDFDQMLQLSPLEQKMMNTKAPYNYNDYVNFGLSASGVKPNEMVESKKKIDQLVSQLKKELVLRQISENILSRSDHILQLLHILVFGEYNPKQHRIDQIISQHSFNCVSSAIFYAIACRSFNIKITGVATTDHVLAQLQLSDSTKIDIETTVKFGFDPSSKTGILDQFGQLTGFTYVDPKNYGQRQEIKDHQMLALIYSNRYDQMTKQGQLKEATALLYRAYLLAGDLPFTSNTWENAINNYIVSLENAKRSPDALYALSKLAVLFPKIDKISQLQYSIYINWTQQLVESEKYQLAITTASEGLTYFANDILLKQNLKAASLNKFYLLSKANDFQSAFKLIEQMINQFPAESDFQTLAINLISNYAKSSSFHIAEDIFLNAISKFPHNLKLKEIFAYHYIKEAEKLKQQNNLSEAIDLLHKAQIEPTIRPFQSMIRPKLLSMLNNLSLKLLNDENYSQAKITIEQGLDLDPSSEPLNHNWDVVMLQWGQQTYNRGDFKAAIQILVNGRQKSKKDRQTFNQLIEAYYNETAFQLLDAKKFEASIIRFEEGLKLLPKSTTLKHNLEIAQSESGSKK